MICENIPAYLLLVYYSHLLVAQAEHLGPVRQLFESDMPLSAVMAEVEYTVPQRNMFHFPFHNTSDFG